MYNKTEIEVVDEVLSDKTLEEIWTTYRLRYRYDTTIVDDRTYGFIYSRFGYAVMCEVFNPFMFRRGLHADETLAPEFVAIEKKYKASNGFDYVILERLAEIYVNFNLPNRMKYSLHDDPELNQRYRQYISNPEKIKPFSEGMDIVINDIIPKIKATGSVDILYIIYTALYLCIRAKDTAKPYIADRSEYMFKEFVKSTKYRKTLNDRYSEYLKQQEIIRAHKDMRYANNQYVAGDTVFVKNK